MSKPRIVDVVPGSTKTMKEFLGKVPVFLKVVSPSCGHCNAMVDAWKQLPLQNLPANVMLASVHVDMVRQLPESIQNLARQGVPTIVLVKPNMEFVEHTGARTAEAMADFVKKVVGKQSGGKQSEHKRSRAKRSRAKRSVHKRSGTRQRGGRTRRRTRAECAREPGPGCNWHARRRARNRRRRTRRRSTRRHRRR